MNSMVASPSPKWKSTLSAIMLILIWVGYWYWHTLEAMAQIWWRTETYTHGLIVPLISFWLIWRDRFRLVAFQPQTTIWFLPLLAVLVVFWLLGELTAVNALTQFSVISIIILAVMTLTGLAISKELAFPLVFLFFAVPIGDFMMPRLMEWTADFTILALRATGIPVYREGQNFVIPSGHWSVVEACSGIRYLIASITVGTLYAYLTYTSLKRRLIFILVSLVVPILANWLRAYLIVMLGHLSNNKLAAGVDHLIYGWVFFGVVISIMFAIGMRWAEPSKFEQPVELLAPRQLQTIQNTWLVTALIIAIVSASPIAEIYLKKTNTGTVVNLSLPSSTGSWQAGTPVIDWKPHFNNSSAELHTAYRQDGRWAGLYLAYYRNQDYESKLVTSANALVTSLDNDWQIISSGLSMVTLSGVDQRIRTAELLRKQSSLDDRYIVWQWYWINGRLTTSDIEAKWLTALSMLTGRGDDSAVVIVYSPKVNAEATLTTFLNELGSEINRSLMETSQR